MQVALLKYTKTFIKTILYNIKNTITSALNFNILKINLSKIASKEVKIYVFENYFLKKRSCATVTYVIGSFYNLILNLIFSFWIRNFNPFIIFKLICLIINFLVVRIIICKFYCNNFINIVYKT